MTTTPLFRRPLTHEDWQQAATIAESIVEAAAAGVFVADAPIPLEECEDVLREARMLGIAPDQARIRAAIGAPA